MSNRLKKKSPFDQEIENVLTQLKNIPANTEEYATAVKNLETLCKASTSRQERKLSADTIVTVVANLLGIGLVLGYEQSHVVTSKALSFIVKPRL